MGGGKSPGSKKTIKATVKAKTPAGITYADFQKLSDADKMDTLNRIIDDDNIKVPDYLDSSVTSKIIYALGMDEKPTTVTDAQLDSMPGQEIFRTVYEGKGMPPPSSADIIDQIRNGDYTQLSGKGGSAYGRALYFAGTCADSASYGKHRVNPQMVRAKVSPDAKMGKYYDLYSGSVNDATFTAKLHSSIGTYSDDKISLYAIYKGYDGWNDGWSSGYNMIINRGKLTMSDTRKSVYSSKSQWGGYNYAKGTNWKKLKTPDKFGMT